VLSEPVDPFQCTLRCEVTPILRHPGLHVHFSKQLTLIIDGDQDLPKVLGHLMIDVFVLLEPYAAVEELLFCAHDRQLSPLTPDNRLGFPS
jgi:hypothetical protein